MPRTKTLIIIPTINEIAGLKKIIPKLVESDFNILIVDDDSIDGSREYILEQELKYGRKINHIFRKKNQGFRSAYFAGFKYALDHNYQNLVMMDGDGAHKPKNVLQMLKNLNNDIGFVVGSRYIKGGKIKSFLIRRRLISLCSNWLIRIFISNKIYDWTSGFMAIKISELEKIYKYDYAEGFSFLVQLKRNFLLVGSNVSEIPIVFANHDEKSKFNIKIALEAFGVFLKIIFEGKRGQKS